MKKIVPVALILMSVVYWYVFARFVPPPLAISRDTTYFTDLKEIDGTISLVPSINALRRIPPDDNAAIEC